MDLSNNSLTHIPWNLGACQSLKEVDLSGNEKLPIEVLKLSKSEVIPFLRAGFKGRATLLSTNRCHVLFVGNACSGKTTLAKALIESPIGESWWNRWFSSKPKVIVNKRSVEPVVGRLPLHSQSQLELTFTDLPGQVISFLLLFLQI